MTTSATPTAASAFSPPQSGSRHDIVAECLACIVYGRPFPPQLRPTVLAASRPATVQEGIARILSGGAANGR